IRGGIYRVKRLPLTDHTAFGEVTAKDNAAHLRADLCDQKGGSAARQFLRQVKALGRDRQRAHAAGPALTPSPTTARIVFFRATADRYGRNGKQAKTEGSK